jgi:hypothetical protein
MKLEANNLQDLLVKKYGTVQNTSTNFENYISSQFSNILVLEKPVNNPNRYATVH